VRSSTSWRHRPSAVLLVVLVAATGCATAERALPGCEPGERLGLVAQSVPGAEYLPCLAELPPGWLVDDVEIRDGQTRFALRSDRADAPVRVRFTDGCDTVGSTPVPPRGDGVRTLQLLDAVAPSYAGMLIDVFPGGCITYSHDFARGPHIALMDELQRAVGLYPRRELRQALRDQLGVELDP
jgi:hypothetical protein